jgi:hypothetical protein
MAGDRTAARTPRAIVRGVIGRSDTERVVYRDAGAPSSDPAAGRASLGAFLYCVTTGLGVGAFCGEPLAWTIAGTIVGVPVAAWVVPAAVRERRDVWRDR